MKPVLAWLQDSNLYVKAEKHEFHTTMTSSPGYKISHQGVEMDLSENMAVREWLQPLQMFTGS